jgi:hypothetical protein
MIHREFGHPRAPTRCGSNHLIAINARPLDQLLQGHVLCRGERVVAEKAIDDLKVVAERKQPGPPEQEILIVSGEALIKPVDDLWRTGNSDQTIRVPDVKNLVGDER